MTRARRALLVVALLAGGAACSDDGGGTADGPATTAAEAATTEAAGTSTAPDDEDADGAEGPSGPVVPGDEWVVSTPEEHGIDPAGLEAARAYAFAEGRNTQGVVVVHEGEIVAEWYADGADAGSWAASWSMAKSFTSAAVGIAVDEGLIGGVDDSVATYLPEWAGTDHEAITVEHLLHMSSGLDWNEAYAGSVDESEIVRMVTTVADQLAFARERPLEVEPGTRWSYSSGDSMLLSGVVEAATGRPLDEYATEVLLDPIGMQQVDWWRDAAGHTLGYCCLDTTSRDYARLGLLYARGGRWGDEQVVPEAWVEASLEPAPASGGLYGYQWWLDEGGDLGVEAFSASGHDVQKIMVVPSLDLVVVRNGTYVKDPGPPVADPTLFSHYPSGGIVPGQGTVPPGSWDDMELLAPIVEAVRGSEAPGRPVPGTERPA